MLEETALFPDVMLSAAVYLATLVYLLPLIVMWGLRARRDRELWEIALDVPLAVAIDFGVVMLLARAVTLEWAAIFARFVWVGGAVGLSLWRLRRRRQGEPLPAISWPRALDRHALCAAALAALIAVWMSTEFSRHCHGFDRGWHIPLATSLKGQTLPFENVYEPRVPLGYHFTGDVLGAMVQTYSGGVAHMSLALGIAHDIMFGMTGGCLALLAWSLGLRSVAPTALAALSPLVAGPLRLFHEDGLRNGYNFINLLKLGYRPHTVVALLLMAGMGGALLVRLQKPGVSLLRGTGPVLVACTGICAVTDEATTGIFGLTLGLVWLVAPRILADKRWQGLLVLVSLLLVVVATNLLFSGALASGAGEGASWVPARAPGYYQRPLSLETAEAIRELKLDVLPVAVVGLGAFIQTLARRTRPAFTLFAFWCVLVFFSYEMLIHVDIGERSVESHRFFTGALFFTPLFGLTWLVGSRRRPSWSFAATLVAAGMVLMAAGSLDWLMRVPNNKAKSCAPPSRYYAPQDFFEVDCRKMAGARLGETPAVHYLDPEVAYLYSGCRPVYAAGPPPRMVRSDRIDLGERRKVKQWTMHIGRMLVGAPAIRDLHEKRLAPGEPLRLICAEARPDGVCRLAKRLGAACAPVVSGVERCELAAAHRGELLRRLGGQNKARPKKKPRPRPAPPLEDEPE